MGASIWMDVKTGWRSFLRHKLVSSVAIVSLALAIAGNSTIFSFVSGLLIRPLPFEEPENLVFVGDRDSNDALLISRDSALNFLDLRERSTNLEDLVAFSGASLGLLGDGEPLPVSVLRVSDGLFEILRYRPYLGRTLQEHDQVPGSHRVVVLSFRFWQSHFGGDAEALFFNVNLSDEIYTVVGVLPAGQEFLDPNLQLFVPLAIDPTAPGDRDDRSLGVFGRMRAGVSFEVADSEMEVIGQQLAVEYPEANRDRGRRLVKIRDYLISPPNRQLILLLQIAMVFVLLIASANVANLLLAQGYERQRELAMRSALGAGRFRITRQLLIQSLLLATTGGLLGLVLTGVAIRLINVSLADQLGSSSNLSLDFPTLAFTAAVVLLSALVFGLAPSLKVSKLDVTSALREGGRGASSGRSRRLLANALVVGQLGLALMMLSGAVLMVRAFRDVQYSSPGFSSEQLLTVRLNPPPSRYSDGGDLSRYFESVAAEVESLPSVASAGFVTSLPRSPFNPTSSYRVDGVDHTPDEKLPEAILLPATSGYFATLGVAVLEGRTFDRTDRVDAAPVVVVNRAFADRNWPDRSPLTERLTIAGRSHEVIGVIGDVWQELLSGEGQGRSPAIYVPQAQAPSTRSMALLVRTAGPPLAIVDGVRSAIWRVDPRISVDRIRTFEEYVAQFFLTKPINVLLTVFGGLALLLSAIGIYGVIAFSAGRRTHEIGLRMALGASRGNVLAMIAKQGLLLLALGFAMGVPGVALTVFGVGRALGAFGVEIDTTVVLPIALLLAAVAGLSTYLPARRAANLEPVRALRYE